MGERVTELAESPFQRQATRIGIAFAQVEAGSVDEARRTISRLQPFQPGEARPPQRPHCCSGIPATPRD